jgi:hypothetical protein
MRSSACLYLIIPFDSISLYTDNIIYIHVWYFFHFFFGWSNIFRLKMKKSRVIYVIYIYIGGEMKIIMQNQIKKVDDTSTQLIHG